MYKEVKSLDQTDAAYIAGLIDGEGTVTLSRRHRSENRQLVVSISNTDRPLLEFVLDTVGAGKITGKRTCQPHHTASYTYTISNRQALALAVSKLLLNRLLTHARVSVFVDSRTWCGEETSATIHFYGTTLANQRGCKRRRITRSRGIDNFTIDHG
jgi:hypothetical protein